MINCINNIKNCVPQKEVKGIKDAFNSPWKDEVHRSFEQYVNLCERETKQLNNCSNSAEQIYTKVSALQVETQIAVANTICTSATMLKTSADVLLSERI